MARLDLFRSREGVAWKAKFVAKQSDLLIENKVDQVFKVGTRCWLNICSKPSTMIQKGYAKGN
jgi:hypothetical protein